MDNKFHWENRNSRLSVGAIGKKGHTLAAKKLS